MNPPKPTAIRRIDGDTRKIGAKKFAASLDSTVEGPRGTVHPTKRLRAVAKAHFVALTEALDAMNMLSTADVGTITMAAVMFEGALKAYAGKTPDWKQVCDCSSKYNQMGDRLGLSPSARARLPKPATEEVDDMEELLA